MKTTKLHQDNSKITFTIKTGPTGRNLELEGEKLANFLYAPRAWALCVALLSACFWGTSRHQNKSHDSFLEIPACLLSNPSGISQFGAHFPLQNFILPQVLPAGAKGGRKVIFMVFLALLIIQNLMKCFSHFLACINYHEKSKNTNFSSSKCPNHKRTSWRATRWAEKPVLRPKFSKMTKTSPNLLKFGAKIPHHASCSSNEASAKIRSGSGLFRRFSALLNLLFRIFIFALQTCM